MIQLPAHPLKYITAKPQTLHRTYHSILKHEQFPREIQFGFNSKIVSDPDIARNVLRYLPKSSIFYDDLSSPVHGSRFLGNGILTATTENAKAQRKKFDSQFRKRMFASFEELMVHETIESTNTFHNERVNVTEFVQTLTLNVVGKTLLGDVFDDTLRDAMLDDVFYINDEVVKHISPVYQFAKYSPLYVHTIATKVISVRNVVRTAIEVRRDSDIEYDDLLNVILHTSAHDEEAIDNVLTFFLAGYDTTASALCTTLQIIHQESQKPLLNQILHELEHDNTHMLECVIKEVLRLHPPSAGGILRTYKEEFREHFPQHWNHNTDIIIPVYSLHRHPKYWDAPDDFVPERWNTISEANMSTVYFPFSTGSRNCIGKHFALLEMKTLLKTLLQRVTFSDMSNTFDFTLSPVYSNNNPVYSVVDKKV